MKQVCIDAVGTALGRRISPAEGRAIEARVLAHMRAAARADIAGFRAKGRARATADAIDQAVAELQSPQLREGATRATLTPDEQAARRPGSLLPQHGAGESRSSEPGAREFDQRAPGFYSAALRAVETSQTGRASAQQWKATLAKTPGVKAEELDWLGVNDWLDGQKGPVTRGALADFVRAHGVQVEETTLDSTARSDLQALVEERERLAGERDFLLRQNRAGLGADNAARLAALDARLADIAPQARAARARLGAGETAYANYQLPGGQNYRELLLTLPVSEDRRRVDAADAMSRNVDGQQVLDPNEVDPGVAALKPEPVFRSSHFKEPNILAHVRLNERVSADGKRTLFLEEVQSDWHQAGRQRGYSDRPIDTRAWQAEKTPGGVPNSWDVTDDLGETYHVIALNAAEARERARFAAMEGAVPDAPFKTTWPALALKRMIRWAAEHGFDQVAWTTGAQQTARYPKLRDVGAGMNAFYDRILVNVANDLGKTFGARVGETTIDQGGAGKPFLERAAAGELGPTGPAQVHALAITAKMRAAVMGEGLPLFQSANDPWARAHAKGLALDDRARLERAQAMGGDVAAWREAEDARDHALAKNRDAYDAADEAIDQRLEADRAAAETAADAARDKAIEEAQQQADAAYDAAEKAAQAAYEAALESADSDADEARAEAAFYEAVESADVARDNAMEKADARAEAAFDKTMERFDDAAEKRAEKERARAFDDWERADEEAEADYEVVVGEMKIKIADGRELSAWNDPFDPNPNEELSQTREGAKGRRGSIVIPPGGLKDGPAVINLFEASDPSTVLHETGHYALELYRMLAHEPDAPAEIVADYDALAAWLGVKDDGEITTDQHETFAESWETYLMEGKPPSPALRGAFSAFKAWLLLVYRTMALPRARLNDQVRDIFDRMLASETEIAAARAEAGPARLFKDQRAAGMSDGDWARYLDAEAGARQASEDELRAQAMAVFLRQKRVWWTRETAKMRARVERAMDQEPVWRAVDWLGFEHWKGDAPPDDRRARPGEDEPGPRWTNVAPPADLAPMRLSRAAIIEDYGPQALAALPTAVAPVAPIDDTRVDELTDIAKQTYRTLNRRAPQRLASFLAAKGGVNDEGGDLLAGIGSYKVRPGLIRKSGGLSIEDAALAAWEAGYFGAGPGKAGLDNNEERPTPRQFIDAVIDDIKGLRPAYRLEDEGAIAERAGAMDWASWFERRGIAIEAAKATIRAQIKAVGEADVAGGVHPDVAADAFGFSSGEALLAALAGAGNRAAQLRARVERAMIDEYGDPFRDGRFAEEARLAAHVDQRARQIEIELDALQRATGGPAAPRRLARAEAERQLRRLTVKQVLNADQFLTAERRAGQDALAALEKGDKPKAAFLKQRQLLNFYLYRAAREAREAIDRERRRWAVLIRHSENPVRSGIDPDYLDKIELLLDGYEIRKARQGAKQFWENARLVDWVARMEAAGEGATLAIAPSIIANAKKRPYTALSYEDFLGLRDTIRNLEHLGRVKSKLLTEQDRRSFAELVGDVAQSIHDNGPRFRGQSVNYSPDAVGRARERVDELHAEHTRPEFLARLLDGNQDNGPVWRALIAPFAKAEDDESKLMRETTALIETAFARYTSAERGKLYTKRIEVPELIMPGRKGYWDPYDPATTAAANAGGPNDPNFRRGTAYFKSEILAIALNWGTESNRQRLLTGFGWSEKQVQTALDRLMTKTDWDVVEAIWAGIDTLWAPLAAMHRKMTGVTPEKVEGIAFTTKHGAIAGKYYPLRYDAKRSETVFEFDAKSAVQDWGASFMKAATRQGHTVTREQFVNLPIKLSLDVLTEHVQNVIHDITHRAAVIDANRLIGAPAVQAAIIGAVGQAQYRQLTPWLKSIAAPRVDPSSFWVKILMGLRTNAAIAMMGFRIATGAQQLTGFFQAIPRVGEAAMAKSIAKLYANPFATRARWDEIRAKSEFMTSRKTNFDRDVRELTARLKAPGWTPALKRMAFAVIAEFDFVVSAAAWDAAYSNALAGKIGAIAPGDETAAIQHADAVVRMTQAAGAAKDLPTIMRGPEGNKLFTAFYSFFSGLYNVLTNEQIAGLRARKIDPARFAANMLWLMIVSPLLAEGLAGRWAPRKGESEEDRDKRLALVVLTYPFMTVIGLRDLVSAVSSGQDYQLSPVGGAINTVAQAATDVGRATTEGRPLLSTDAQRKRAVLAASYLFGLPGLALWTPLDYVGDLIAGDEDPGADPVDAAREAVVSDTR